MSDHATKPINIEDIMDAVCAEYDVSIDDMLSEWRAESITRPRHIAMYLARTLTRHTLPRIGSEFNRDHSTVKSGIKSIEHHLARDQILRLRMDRINTHLGVTDEYMKMLRCEAGTEELARLQAKATAIATVRAFERSVFRLAERDPKGLVQALNQALEHMESK